MKSISIESLPVKVQNLVKSYDIYTQYIESYSQMLDVQERNAEIRTMLNILGYNIDNELNVTQIDPVNIPSEYVYCSYFYTDSFIELVSEFNKKLKSVMDELYSGTTKEDRKKFLIETVIPNISKYTKKTITVQEDVYSYHLKETHEEMYLMTLQGEFNV